MKKKLIIGSTALVIFSLGALTGGASSTWVQNLIADGNKRVNSAAYYKKEELIGNIDQKIQEKLSANMETKITVREQQVTQELEDYFNQKVESLNSPEESAFIDQELDKNASEIVDRYKLEIDNAFGTIN
ncbi:hypothetical protein P9E34_14075 [Schinkia azotoformans]|uniref:hypothetical protein n=1 Tax=Schinkia azotoformans TaxID=1454 RepID=UPI002DB65D04|nr:hypothetical protein [Schinkia azotoformans]MEC1725843.1 hypothetical protein [Schinkia azotoformans]